MKKSNEKITSPKSSSDEKLFSMKRYFVNNIDSYHGGHIVKALSKILEKNLFSSKETSQTIVGEDFEPVVPATPEQPFEIIGTATDPKIKIPDNVSRIIPKSECLPQMLTSGTVILDISYAREELKLADDFIKRRNVKKTLS